MYNPFIPLRKEMLDRLIDAGHKYFVRQTYERGRGLTNTHLKGIFLISHYKDFNQATTHYTSTIKFDRHKYIYDISYEEERGKLYKAATQPEGYLVYSSLFNFEIEKWAPDTVLAKKMELYLRVAGWKAREGKISVAISNQLGIIYITFRRNGEVMKVDLSEIEEI